MESMSVNSIFLITNRYNEDLGHGVANGSADATDPIQQPLNLIVIDKPR